MYTSTGYCSCGQEIWIEYQWVDGRWRARFCDAGGAELTHCPACGREIIEDELASR